MVRRLCVLNVKDQDVRESTGVANNVAIEIVASDLKHVKATSLEHLRNEFTQFRSLHGDNNSNFSVVLSVRRRKIFLWSGWEVRGDFVSGLANRLQLLGKLSNARRRGLNISHNLNHLFTIIKIFRK